MNILRKKQKPITWGIKRLDGTLATEKGEILDIWANFYEKLYHEIPVPQQELLQLNNEPPLLPPITRSEIENGIQKLKENKAPDIDNIPEELIKHGGEPIKLALENLFNKIITSVRAPKE